MRILITGGAGFIGSHLSNKLSSLGNDITVLDSLTTQVHGDSPQYENLIKSNPKINFVRGDIRDKELLNKLLFNCDIVVHLAAETGTSQSMYQINHYYDVNVLATAALFNLIALNHKHIKKIIFASSRSVYGEGAYLLGNEFYVPQSRNADQLKTKDWECKGPNGESLNLVATSEQIFTRPSSIYAATKLACEQMADIISGAYGIKIVTLRFQNVYGEGQSLKNPYTGIISIFANRMRNDLPINIFEDGNESRDFIHVSDVVESIQLSISDKITNSTIINIGSGIPTTVLSIAEILKNKLKSHSDIKVSGDFRVGDIRHCYADLTLAKQILNFTPKLSIEKGLNFFCEWFENQAPEVDKSENALQELSSIGLAR